MKDWTDTAFLSLISGLAGIGSTMLVYSLHGKVTFKLPKIKPKIGAIKTMKSEWTVLIISAITDFILTFATALLAVMQATGNGQMPSNAALLTAALGALISAGRTIQQALKANPISSANLRGEEPPKVVTVISGPPVMEVIAPKEFPAPAPHT